MGATSVPFRYRVLFNTTMHKLGKSEKVDEEL